MDGQRPSVRWSQRWNKLSAGLESVADLSTIELQPVTYDSSESPKASGDGTSMSNVYYHPASVSANDSCPLISRTTASAATTVTAIPLTQPSTPLMLSLTGEEVRSGYTDDVPPVALATIPETRRSALKTLGLWTAELVAAVFVIVLLVGEIILFVHYDHKFIFSSYDDRKDGAHAATWPFDFKINAAFALITAFMEATMAFYVASCIGQMRRHWYKRKANRLDWLDAMSEARGPHGAAKLLFRPGMLK